MLLLILFFLFGIGLEARILFSKEFRIGEEVTFNNLLGGFGEEVGVEEFDIIVDDIVGALQQVLSLSLVSLCFLHGKNGAAA